MKQVLIERACEIVNLADDKAAILEAVSYTHLTLPTNREV